MRTAVKIRCAATLVCGVFVIVAASGCGASAASTTTAAGAATTTQAGIATVPAALSSADARAAYLNTVAPLNTAIAGFRTTISASTPSNPAQALAVSGPLARALQTFASRLLATPLTGQTRTDAITLVRETGTLAGTINSASTLRVFAGGEWEQYVIGVLTQVQYDEKIVRADLGIPATPS